MPNTQKQVVTQDPPVKLTVEDLDNLLPKKVATDTVKKTIVAEFNQMQEGEEVIEAMKENILTYNYVLRTGKYKFSNYVNAIRYITLKMMGLNNKEAWMRAFPKRYQELIDRNYTPKDIAATYTIYNNSKLVVELYKIAMIPSYLLNAGAFQEAVNTQVAIIRNEDASFKVRSDAANSLMTHLKQPEENKLSIDIGIKQDTSIIEDLRQATVKLAKAQKDAISAGLGTAKQLAESPLKFNNSDEETIDVETNSA